MAEQWMQSAVKHPGSFTRQAKAAGEGVQEYARDVLKPGSHADPRTKKRAVLARTFSRFSHRR